MSQIPQSNRLVWIRFGVPILRLLYMCHMMQKLQPALRGNRHKDSPWARRRWSPSAQWPTPRQLKRWSWTSWRKWAAPPWTPCSNNTQRTQRHEAWSSQKNTQKNPESRLWDCVNVCEPQEERNSSATWRKGLCSHSPYRQEPVHQDDGL